MEENFDMNAWFEKAHNLAMESDIYKNGLYKIGDRIHIKEVSGIDSNVFFEADCTLSDVVLVYETENFTPVLGYLVRLDDGEERKIRGIESIQYKIDK